MTNVTNPVTASDPIMCQMRCSETPGCFAWGFKKKESQCWLSGADAVLQNSSSIGIAAGYANCNETSASCNTLPTSGFPGVTASQSRLAWPITKEQPANLQCWPRKPNGFPDLCENQTVTVLQDTSHGWPGRCEGAQKITNLGASETCQTRCFASPLCAFWAVENSSSFDGSLTCWQGMFGSNCYDSTNGLQPQPDGYFRAQRVMHGTFRVLMNTANMEIQRLTKAFGTEMHPDWKEGAKACRMTCLSYLLCQFWQYSDVFGCFVEDNLEDRPYYPLVQGQGVSYTSEMARTVKVGEYIQHTCRPGPQVPLPLDPPPQIASTGVTPPPPGRRHGPEYGELGFGSSTGNEFSAVASGESAVSSSTGGGSKKKSSGWPFWASMLLCAAAALCIGVAGAVVWLTHIDVDRPLSGKKGKGKSRKKGTESSDASSLTYDQGQDEQASLLAQQQAMYPQHQAWFGQQHGHSMHGMYGAQGMQWPQMPSTQNVGYGGYGAPPMTQQMFPQQGQQGYGGY